MRSVAPRVNRSSGPHTDGRNFLTGHHAVRLPLTLPLPLPLPLPLTLTLTRSPYPPWEPHRAAGDLLRLLGRVLEPARLPGEA